jgi:YidC/Oxa1 family membrane protein insertase
MLVQLPVLFGLYRGIFNSIQGSTTTHFLWISNVSQSVHDACCKDSWGNVFSQPALLIIPLIAAAATYMQSRMMMPPLRDNMSDQERSMVSVSKNMSYIFPVMIFIMSLSFPQGLAMYWVTNTLVMVSQQYHLVGWGSLHVPSWVPGAHRVTALSYPKEGHAPPGRTGGTTTRAGAGTGAARTGTPVVPSRNGSNGPAPKATGQPVTAAAAPGRGRAPARAQKKAKRRR